MQNENDGEDVMIPELLAEGISRSKDKGKAGAEKDTPQFLVDDDEEEEEEDENPSERAVKGISTVSKGAKRPTKIFKRTDEEKKAWEALTANSTLRVLGQLARSNAIPWANGVKKPELTELLFKRLEILPTGLELDEFREAVKAPTRDKWLKENWGKEEFAKAQESFKPKVELLLRGEPKGKGLQDFIEDLDIENWKGKKNICMLRKSRNPKYFGGPSRIRWNWAEAIWIATGDKDLAFESAKEGIEM